MTDFADWTRVANLARLAPTPHNTQPFRVRPRTNTAATLVLLCERLLPEEDHGNLYVLSSFGVFIDALERAARAHGLVLVVTPVSTLDPGALARESGVVVLGEAEITGRCDSDPRHQLLEARRTSRLPYHDRRVDEATIQSLITMAATGGHRMIVSSDVAVVAPLLRLNATAIIDNLQLTKEREEIRAWHRMGATPQFGDGLWQMPMNQPAWELRTAFATPRLFTLPVFRSFAIHRYLATQRGTRHIALLCGAFQQWPELIRAGRMLLSLWLRMAECDVYMQPFGSMLTNPHYAKQIADQFGVRNCWLIVRFGFSDPPPRAPRLETIVVHE